MSTVVFCCCVLFILYTYAGYPLLLFILAGFRKRRTISASFPLPSITLFILAYNEEEVIAEKIENSLALEYAEGKLQIVVVTDGSDDDTVDIVRRYERRGIAYTHRAPRKGKSAAIGRALPLATGEVVLYSDANNLYNSDALLRIAAHFEDPTVGGVTGVKRIRQEGDLLGESEGLYWQYESFIRRQETVLGCCTGVIGEMFAVRRNLLEVPYAHIINDDFFMALKIMRKGYRIVYTPDACSYERISVSSRDEVERRSRIVAGRYQLMMMARELLPFRKPFLLWQIVSHKFFRPLIPFAMMGALMSNIFLVSASLHTGEDIFRPISSSMAWSLLCMQGLFYAAALFGGHLKSSGLSGKLVYLPIFLVRSNLAALKGFCLFMTGRQTPLWTRVARRKEK